MKSKFLLLVVMFLTSLQVAVAQSRSVQGTVVDEQGEPVLGATILPVGMKTGVITNSDGAFEIPDLPSSVKKLRVSYVGMKTREVAVHHNMRIVLEDDGQLVDEVIVTAFGTAKKSAFTGSAVVIDEDQIQRKQVSSVLQSLEGQVPGLQIAPSTSPGTSSDITVRGIGSINADTAPLIVLDGIPYDGSYNSINPHDVESVTVLKDAASNALYGARGANGVIMITTKKAKKGEAVVTVDAKWGSNSKAVSDYDRITNPGQYYETHFAALYNSYLNNGMSAESAYQQASSVLTSNATGGLGYNVYTVPNGENLIGRNGKLNPNAQLGREYNGYWLTPDNWYDEIYQSGLRQEYNVNISGGNDKSQVYGSFGYLNEDGIVLKSNYERYTARIKAQYQAKSWLLFGANAGYTRSTQTWPVQDSDYTTSSIFGIAQNAGAIYPMYVRNADGSIMSDSKGRVYDYGYGENADLLRPWSQQNNAAGDAEYNTNEEVTNALNGSAFVDITFLKDFKFTFNAGVNVDEIQSTVAENPYYGYSANSNGILTKSHYRTTSFNFQQLLNYNKQIGKHNISVLLGHENYDYKYELLSASKSGAASYETNLELNGWLVTRGDPGSYTTDYNTEGYFFRGMYNYDEKYFGSVSYRRDASSRFHPDHRWGNFWSFGGAWIISRESWFTPSWINNLKLKASLGQQGNDGIGDFRYMDTYTISNNNGSASYTLYTKGNKDITWETNTNLNIGIEFGLFNDRLTGSFEFYNRKTTDMLYFKTVPSSLGYTGYYDNIGDMRNSGIELMLRGSVIRTKDIDWSLNLNLTHNSNKVTMLPAENRAYEVEGYYGYSTSAAYGGNIFVGEGLPLNTWYMRKFAGVADDGQALYYYTDKNGDRQTTTSYSDADMYLCGTSLPKVFGGFGTSLTAYGFDLGVQFTYSLGGKCYDYEYAQLMTPPQGTNVGYAMHKDVLKAWSPTNTGSSIPRYYYNDYYTGSVSDRFLTSGSYLSLQNIQLGYTLPEALVKKAYLSKVRVYVTCDNLCFWSKRKGFDPRYSNGYGDYSPMRTISGGITVQF